MGLVRWLPSCINHRNWILVSRTNSPCVTGLIMNQVCRCCLAENPTVAFNIFHENLRAELLSCVPSLNIEPDDGLPELICDLCWLRLREAVEFRRRCEENDRELRKRYDETSQAIEQALGLNILEQLGTDASLQLSNGSDLLTGEVGVAGHGEQNAPETDISVLQLLEEYSNLEMTMLDELMLGDNSFASLPDSYRCNSLRKEDEDPIINELLAKFLDDPAIDPAASSAPACQEANVISENRSLGEQQSTTARVVEAAQKPVAPSEKKTKKTPPKSLHLCPQCDKKFTRNFQLKLHLISVHGVGDGLQYTCEECGKTFASRHSLNYHQKALHSLERPFACTHCTRSFVLRTQLASHLRIHTGEVKPRIFQCPKCEKAWPTRSDLKTHMRSHDPHAFERPFKCQRCTKSFFTQGHLSSHELVHTGEKPYRCGLCDRAYQNVGNLNNHIFRSHSEVLTNRRPGGGAAGTEAISNAL